MYNTTISIVNGVIVNMHPHQKIILVDQDNVIADQFGLFHKRLKERRPDIYATYSGVDNDFQFEKNFDPEFAEDIWAIRREEGFFSALSPVEGALDALRLITSLGHSVFIVTAPIRTAYSASEKLDWIKEHLGDDWVKRTIITREKTLVRGDILIDDNPEVTGVCTPTWEHILFDRPHNQGGTKKRLNWQNFHKVLDI